MQAAFDGTKQHSERSVLVHPAHDIFALGIIAFEALAGMKAFGTPLDFSRGKAYCSVEEMMLCAAGSVPYPWERPVNLQHGQWQKSKLWPLVAKCLHRQAKMRPSAEQLCAQLTELYAG